MGYHLQLWELELWYNFGLERGKSVHMFFRVRPGSLREERLPPSLLRVLS